MKDYKTITEELHEGMATLGEAIPETMGAFSKVMEGAAGKDGALPVKTKELIALSIAISLRCDGCIGHHAKAVIEAGASRQEVADTIAVAVMMGGGPSVVYGVEALRAFDQLQAAGD